MFVMAASVLVVQVTFVIVGGLTELSTVCPVPDVSEKVVATSAPPVPMDKMPPVKHPLESKRFVSTPVTRSMVSVAAVPVIVKELSEDVTISVSVEESATGLVPDGV